MASKFFFNGQIYSTPVTVSQVNDTAFAPTGANIGTVLAIVGASDGGQPNVPLTFTDPNTVDQVLVHGPLNHAVKKAFYPTPGGSAPNKVIAMRIGTATQATLQLMDANSAASALITSVQYGLPANLDKIKVEAGSIQGLRISTMFNNTYFSADNVYRSAFTVQYVGGNASATMSITNSTVTLSSPTGTVVATFDLTAIASINLLTDRISAVPGFTATYGPKAQTLPALNSLDSVSSVDVKTTLYTATGNLQAVVDYLNSAGQGIVTASRPAGAGQPPAIIPWTYLTGGTNPANTITDWTNALTALQAVDAQLIVQLTGTAAVLAAGDAHCAFMSNAGRRERRQIGGPELATTQSAVLALAQSLNSDRSVVCWPGHYDFEYATGVLTLYAPWMTAVIVASGFSALPPGKSMTNKVVNVQGMEVVVSNPTMTDPLIQGGVTTITNETAGFTVARAVTTWLQNDNYNRVEVSCGIAVDYTMRFVRSQVDPLRGGDASPLALARCITQTETALRTLAVPAPNGPGVLVGDANSPAYKNITASISGDILLPNFQCSPVIPLNFIGITAAIVPYSGTASA